MNRHRYRCFTSRRYGIGMVPAGPPAIALAGNPTDWPEFWRMVADHLRGQGYSTGTLMLYRHVLRQFSRWFYSTPDRVTTRAVRSYICGLAERRGSWSWTSMNICILRAVFDRLCGMSVCGGLVSPKRPQSLPSFLGPDEVWRLLSAADTPRDQLLLGLIYGCGLKVGEVCRLRWADVDCASRELAIAGRGGARRVAFPGQLAPLLEKGVQTCLPADYVFRGAREGAHLSTRMAEYVLRRTAELAKLDRPVCCMTLRHSYAVHGLADGATVRQVQEALGLRSIHGAMRYMRCTVPIGACSPLEAFAGAERRAAPPAVPVPDLPPALPFEPVDASLSDRARLFYRSLKLHIRRRFLSFRHATDTG